MPTASLPAPPDSTTVKGKTIAWIGITFAILATICALYGKISIPTFGTKTNPAPVANYSPNTICEMPNAQRVAAELNNPLGIKFYPVVALKYGGRDSGRMAKDGGSFASFDSPKKGIEAGKKILTNSYADVTIDSTLRRWSNGGYDGSIVAKTLSPETKIKDLTEKQLNALIAAMQEREGMTPSATAVLYVNPNNHLLDHIEEFTVEPSNGCFTYDWVIAPRYWRTWHIEYIGDNPDVKIGIWFFGWDHAQGPFSPAKFPDYYYPPSNRWRLQSTDKVKVRYSQTS